MSISNGGFEDGNNGVATDWTHTTVGTEEEYAPFTATPVNVGYDSFEWYTSLDEYEGLLVDLDPAIFESGPGQKLYENFEALWGASYLITTITAENALFGSIEYDSYETDWGSFWYTLAQAGSTNAEFDTLPQEYEDFEDDWGLVSPQVIIPDYPSWISGADLTAATFDNTGGGGGAADEYEPFDDTAFPTLTL